MNRILQALKFMPRHRDDSRRSQNLGLDELLDENRKIDSLDGGTLDLVLMGYRFHSKATKEIDIFLNNKKLKPIAIEDLLTLCFASLMTRDKIPVAVQLNNFVEAAAIRFGPHTKSLVNAFGRSILRKIDALKLELHQNGKSWLPSELQTRWAAHSDLLETIASKVFERPPKGLSAFFKDSKQIVSHERKSLEEWESLESSQQTFQAVDIGSWNLIKWIVEKLSTQSLTKTSTFLDACAAPGGKCIGLSRLLPNDWKFLATESKFNRLQRLDSNINRWQKFDPLKNPIQTMLFKWGEDNPKILLEKDSQFSNWEVVLADLPCSGSGTLHTRPDLLNEDLAKRIQEIMPIQEKILKHLLTLKYKNLFVSLCSIDPLEIAHVTHLLQRDPQFRSWQIPDGGLSEGLVAWHLEDC